ncbi:Eco47II family restriction endonuclease, partial [Zymomonas mobilis]|uniref:Eco47II family restriction endonuclease n=1 Tax=Zymomonas mobilis TaxID=542 RepID=UPI0039E8081C
SIISKAYKKYQEEIDLEKNTLDCFSCVIESSIRNMTLEQWKEAEKARQLQKTLQNDIGNMHQEILSTIDGIRDLKVGEIVDLESIDKKFIAEIKNKFNTTKGNHKVSIYDDIENKLKEYDDDFIGYYVEILPQKKKKYNKEFTPSDNNTKSCRPINERIRIIDGYSFYAMVTGKENALEELFFKFPSMIKDILNDMDMYNSNYISNVELREMFYSVF